jgi:hypothetical protein
MGSSAIAWVNAARKQNPVAQVFCVDTWLGSPEHYLWGTEGEWGQTALGLSERGPSFFDDFLANIHAAGLADAVSPMRATSSSALPYLKKLGERFDVIYVDGAHDAHSVFQDLHHSLELVSAGGIVCGDDFNWDSVRNGLRILALIRRREKLCFLALDNSVIILEAHSRQLQQELLERGYEAWRPFPLAETLNPLRLAQSLFLAALF